MGCMSNSDVFINIPNDDGTVRNGKNHLRAQLQMNDEAKFHLDLDGRVVLQGLGLFHLKGIKEPLMLVEACDKALTYRSEAFPRPKGNVAEIRLVIENPDDYSGSSGVDFYANLPGEIHATMSEIPEDVIDSNSDNQSPVGRFARSKRSWNFSLCAPRVVYLSGWACRVARRHT
eukprot:scaffold170178_cov45-Prasinocladus_malaysianus.AAC.1